MRGEGGYIIHPPSPGYRIISDAPIAHWPDWLLQPGLVLPPLPKERPVSQGPRKPVSDDVADAFIDRTLDQMRSAADGSKHFVLRNMAMLLGGIQQQAGFSDTEAVRWLLEALLAGVKDERVAEKTARWGLEVGAANPIELKAPISKDQAKAVARTAYQLARRHLSRDRIQAELRAFARRHRIDDEAVFRIAEHCLRGDHHGS